MTAPNASLTVTQSDRIDHVVGVRFNTIFPRESFDLEPVAAMTLLRDYLDGKLVALKVAPFEVSSIVYADGRTSYASWRRWGNSLSLQSPCGSMLLMAQFQ